MKTRQISLAFQTDKTPAEYIALAKLVNEYEFDGVSVYCDAPYQPSYGPLLLMAPHLQHARLGPAAISPFRMHPIDIAANTALLAGLAQEGVYIGLARGAWLDDFGIPEPRHPLQGIREAAGIISYLLTGQTGGYQGEVFQLAKHVRAPYPLPDEAPPLLIGTWGPKLAAVAGEIADEVKVGGSANPALAPWMMTHIQRGEQRAERPPGSVGLVFGAVMLVDTDRQRARQAAKRSLALYLPVVAGMDRTVEIEPELLRRIASRVNQGQPEQAAALISDELLDFFAFAGNPGDIIMQVENLFEAGVTRIEFGTPHGLSPQEGLQLIGKQVLPNLRSGE